MPDAPQTAEAEFGTGRPHGTVRFVGRRMAAALKSLLAARATPNKYTGNPLPLRAEPAPDLRAVSLASKGGSDGGNLATRAEREKARRKRFTARMESPGQADRRARICRLNAVEVKKDHKGYYVAIRSGGKRRAFSVASDEIGAVLKDLEAAIQIVRTQC